MICNLCPRQCKAQRTETENLTGYCKMPLLPRVARADLHFWEEPIISGKKGSGTVFFSGCPLSCIYCQNSEISQGRKGRNITVSQLADVFRELEDRGAENINLVTPTHYALAIKEALDIYRPSIPVVYNSGGYERVETLKMLEGYIDVFLTDIKYISKERAKEYSCAADYPEYALNAIKETVRQQPETVIENGIIKKGVIIRHLLLPRATNEAIQIFDWVMENAPKAYFSIMSQYVPLYKAIEHPVINRKITVREYEKVVEHILNSGFENVFIQEKSSANEQYIPEFNY